MNDTAQKVVDETLDVVGETLETVERIPKLRLNGTTRHQQIVILAAAALGGAVVGSVVTYGVVRKRLKYHFEEVARQEVQDAKKFYSRLHKVNPDGTPLSVEELFPTAEAATDAADAVASYAPTDDATPAPVERKKGPRARVDGPVTDYAAAFRLPPETRTDEPEETEEDRTQFLEQVAQGLQSVVVEAKQAETAERVHNIFREAAAADGFDYDAEIARRNMSPIGLPFLITVDEFNQNPDDYDQSGLTYYEKDQILADERDMPIDDDLINSDNLARFGEGSGDPRLVYVRNPVLEIDFMIRKSDSSFAKQVANLDEDHLEHSDGPRIRKMRRER